MAQDKWHLVAAAVHSFYPGAAAAPEGGYSTYREKQSYGLSSLRRSLVTHDSCHSPRPRPPVPLPMAATPSSRIGDVALETD